MIAAAARGSGFCAHPVERRRLRTASPRRWWNGGVRARHGITAFRPAHLRPDGSWPGSPTRSSRGLEVNFLLGHFASAQADHFARMAQAGLRAIFFGIESGCPEVLNRAVGKGLDLARVRETVRAAQAAGIFVVTSMIVPLPIDTEETLAESLQFLREVRPTRCPCSSRALSAHPWWNNPTAYELDFDPEQYTAGGSTTKSSYCFPVALGAAAVSSDGDGLPGIYRKDDGAARAGGGGDPNRGAR